MQSEPVVPGVSRDLATSRAGRVSALRYDLHFSIPEDPAEPLEGHVTIRFDLASTAGPLALDFRPDAGQVLSVAADHKPIPYAVENEHIVLPASALKLTDNAIQLTFRAPQDALNRNPDYLFTLFVPDRARTAFPLFDQPDLKARFTLSLEVPSDWRALANATQTSETVSDTRRRVTFAPSEPIASYLFAFVAGKFDAVTRQVNGRSMTLLHRETDPEKLRQNLDEIFALHAASIHWLEAYTDIPYPFAKLDFALIPDFPYGGMEHVGAIAYRASALLLDKSPPETRLLNRAQLIAHETAHMWFGNLVTMRWFDDVWTKEVFANFMADKIVNPQFPAIDHDLNFLSNHYPQAYAVDRSEGANPIRQRLDNLNLAGQMYGPIIYHKAPIMMRQLERLLGEEAFRDGLREYLKGFAFANATWPGLVDILDRKTPIDLAKWSEVWVSSPGMPTFAFTDQRPANASASGTEITTDAGLWLDQIDPGGAQRLWPQQFSIINLADPATPQASLVAEKTTTLPWAGAAIDRDQLLLNANGLGYGRFPASPALLAHWDTLDDLQRGVLLTNLYENLLSGTTIEAAVYLQALLNLLAEETNALLIELVAGQLPQIYLSLLGTQQRQAMGAALETTLWDTLVAQDDPGMTRIFFELFAATALSPQALAKLLGVWDGSLQLEQLILDEPERIDLAELLAVRIPAQADAIVAKQLADTQNPDRQRRLAFIAPALSGDPGARDAFFASLADVGNRATEAWVADAVQRLHDPTRLEHSIRYLMPSLDLLEEIQVTGDIFFPSAWLNATLGNHHSMEAAGQVRAFLRGRPDYNPQLRMKILQAADPLFRAAAIRSD